VGENLQDHPTAHPHATVLAIAERAAALITGRLV
jgi:hypothetical protein